MSLQISAQATPYGRFRPGPPHRLPPDRPDLHKLRDIGDDILRYHIFPGRPVASTKTLARHWRVSQARIRDIRLTIEDAMLNYGDDALLRRINPQLPWSREQQARKSFKNQLRALDWPARIRRREQHDREAQQCRSRGRARVLREAGLPLIWIETRANWTRTP